MIDLKEVGLIEIVLLLVVVPLEVAELVVLLLVVFGLEVGLILFIYLNPLSLVNKFKRVTFK